MTLRTFIEKRRVQILVTLCILLGLFIGTEVILRFLYEASGAFNDDSPVYWTIGRGIVNGLVPYRDLLEIKPPGIFLVSALSYALTDSMSLGFIQQGLIFVLLPIVILAPLLLQWKKIESPQRWYTLLFLMGCAGALTMYTALTSGEFQTESFGVLFACGYVGSAWMLRERATPLRLITATLCFFGAAFFKEPFVLAMAVAGLLLCRSWKDILFLLVIPGAIAGALFFIGIAVFGSFQDYINVYLPFMINGRVQRFGSPFQRSTLLELTAMSLWNFSPFLALALGLLWLWHMVRSARLDLTTLSDTLRFVVLITGIIALFYGVQIHRTLVWITANWTPELSAGWMITGVIMIIGSIVSILQGTHDRLRVTRDIAFSLLALWIVGYLAGIAGDFIQHHFAFAVAIYLSLIFLFLETEILAQKTLSRFVALIIVLIVSSSVLHARTNTEEQRSVWSSNATIEQRLAVSIDALLDACDVPQYLIVGEPGTNVFGFTKHSPMGPIFFQHTFATGYLNFFMSFLDQISSAHIIITKLPLARPHIQGVVEYVQYAFTETPPPCAVGKTLDSPLGLQVFYRVKSPPMTLRSNPDGRAYVDFPKEK